MNFKLDDNAVRSRSRAFVLAAMAVFLISAAQHAEAGALDAAAVKNLVSGHTWQVKFGSGVVAFWSWKSDGTLCPRQDKDGDCVDNGTWKLDGGRLCYELTYLGGSEGWKSNCLRIVDHGQGRYEALQDNGLTFWEFAVAE
jgi:hypothetical protein